MTVASTAVDRVLARLKSVKPTKNGWEARCPAHPDRVASLSISQGEDGRALVFCQAGCSQESVVAALNLAMSDLMEPSPGRHTSNGNHALPSRKVFESPEDALYGAARMMRSAANGQGEPGGVWWYYNVAGEKIRGTVRWNLPNGGKEIRPISRDERNQWSICDWPDHRPLYGLPELAAANSEAVVFVTEGEKAADAAISIGLVATSSPGGAKAPSKADWSILAGRNVVILPDADEAGELFAADVAKILASLNPPATVKIVRLPSVNKGDDIHDWIVRKGEAAEPESMAAEILAMVAATKQWTPPGTNAAIQPISAGDLLDAHPRLRESVIDGLARRGETLNIISTSKIGKSWLGYSLLFSVIEGGRWLDAFDCIAGKVLLIDNELHPETLARRLDATAAAMQTSGDWRGWLDILSLRGRVLDLNSLEPTVLAIEAGKYALILADAFYRLLPVGVDENSNAAMTGLYNTIDAYADHLGAAWVNIHHASKGDQSGKQVTDVGAGAGAQSRAADTHLILRPHEEEGVVVLEAAVRSFAPVEPLSIRWAYPLWQRDGANPKLLKRPPNAQELKREAEDAAARAKIIAEMAGGDTTTERQIRNLIGCGKPRAEKLLCQLLQGGEIVLDLSTKGPHDSDVYRLSDP